MDCLSQILELKVSEYCQKNQKRNGDANLQTLDWTTPRGDIMASPLPTLLSLDATEVSLETELLKGLCNVKCLAAKNQEQVGR